MRWNVKIEYKAADDVYEYVVSPKISSELAQKIIQRNGDRMSPNPTPMSILQYLPRLHGVATTRRDVAEHIKSWILAEEAKQGVNVFDEEIEIG